MILGLGSDLIDIRRIERVLLRYGDRFARRCFTPVEREAADRRLRRAETYAKRYAAKEAVAKALGTGLAQGISWQEIGVENLPGGKPVVRLSGRAARRLAEMTPPGMVAQVELTLTDEPPLAQAMALISALPEAALTGR
ncbi:holo-ACP synthase [Geminicoccus roseus]|uniref:holo-ACP synthase n=1 Tax=Geminicoccus roseus TaxID=404900 RepID=UPI00040533CA|nr:holo-ACP synthase [Geminicoccus roseus]